MELRVTEAYCDSEGLAHKQSYPAKLLLAVRDAATIFSSTLVLIAFGYCTAKTRKILLLAVGKTGRIIWGLVQGRSTSRLTNANHHQQQNRQKDRGAKKLFHEESPNSSRYWKQVWSDDRTGGARKSIVGTALQKSRNTNPDDYPVAIASVLIRDRS